MQMDMFGSTKTVHSVSQITGLLNRLITQHRPFQNVSVRGEVSNCTFHGSGVIYFTLKDEKNQMSCVLLWNSASRFGPFLRGGEEVLVEGKIEIYGPHGKYQVKVNNVEPLGIGVLQRTFQELKQRLSDEGLFDDAHKKPLPKFPKKIGIVTSASGKAIGDIRRRLHEKYRLAEIVLHPTLVQGPNAAPSIVQAIRTMNTRDDIDVLIVGRGGGSLEDLWAFNEEMVARAIFASRIPVVSAVGHEGDFLISDIVADHRSSTPLAAGADVVPDQQELLAQLDGFDVRLQRAIESRLKHHETRLQEFETNLSPTRRKEAINQLFQRVDDLESACRSIIIQRLDSAERDLYVLAQHLNALSPLATLKRGYSITRKMGGEVLTSTEQTGIGDRIEIQLSEGHLACRVEEIRPNTNQVSESD